MSQLRVKTGFAIALAWPATYCKEPGAWYDPVTRWLGFNRYNYYRAGHAALVLVDNTGRKNHYFDFGRYHAPLWHGRVRSGETDHDLVMKTVPEISSDGNGLTNFDEILTELQQNAACHGEGKLFASTIPINFRSAYTKALQMQEASPLPYGPFIPGGSNCSRFVNTVIRAGRPEWKYRFRLKYFVPLTPTPMNNVNSLRQKTVLPVMRHTVPFMPFRRLTSEEVLSTLPAPERHPAVPKHAQWLSGEGAGSWFFPEIRGGLLKVTRYAPDGTRECSGYFRQVNGDYLLMDQNGFEQGRFRFVHLSNCRKVVVQEDSGNRYYFSRTEPEFLPDHQSLSLINHARYVEVALLQK